MRSHCPNPARIWPRLWGYVVCVLLGLAAAQPILITRRLPQGHDALFHLFRTVELDSLLHAGVPYARWAPDLVRGFGYPLFNYYAPLSYYVAEALHLLGLQFVPALLGAFALSLVLAALGMYLWTRDIIGERPALLAAAAYVLSPYLIVNLTTRSTYAEEFALALLPFALFAMHRLLTRRRLRYAVLLSLSLAAVVLSHNVTAALFLPFLVAYGAVVAYVHMKDLPERAARKQVLASAAVALVAIVTAMGMSAFFWLPALAESKLVQMNFLTFSSLYDYRLNFESLGRIFSLPGFSDLHLLNRPVYYSLGLIAGLLALVSVLGLWLFRPARALRAQIGFAALAVCGIVLMVLPISALVWAALPPMHILQFPWRFVGPGTVFLAFLSGASLRVVEGRAGRAKRWPALALPVAVGLLFVWVFAWQAVPKYYDLAGTLTVDDLVHLERTGALCVGTTTGGEYLPVTVKKYPPPEQETTPYSRARLDLTSLPEGTQVQSAQWQPLEYRLTLDASRSFTAVFNTYDYPGWRAWVDGVLAPITPTDPYGLISVPVPAGQHAVRVDFGSTPVRTLADAISLASLVLGAGALALVTVRRRARALTSASPASAQPPLAAAMPPSTGDVALAGPARLTVGVACGVIGVLVAGFLAKSLLVDPLRANYRRTHFDIAANANYANHIVLVGADKPATVRPGEQATVVLYWRVPAPTSAEYSTSVQLVDAQGRPLAQSDHQHPGGLPTTTWTVAEYTRDPHSLTIPAGTPPGRYTLRVATYPYGKPGETLSVLDASGAPTGRSVDLLTVEVGRPAQPPRPSDVAIAQRLEAPAGSSLQLLGCDLPQQAIGTGEKLPLSLYWKATERLAAGLSVQIQFVDEAGAVAYQHDVAPVPGYDTSLWQAGDVWRGAQALTIPPRLAGRYTIRVAWQGEGAVTLGALEVRAPAHALVAPQTPFAQTATFADVASLIGYDIAGQAKPGQQMTVTLTWRAEREVAEQYKTFVHLLGADGRMVAGSDTVPGDWQRPSPSWVAGEYITDPHALQLPQDLAAGSYRLEVGLYDAASGKRAPLNGGTDALLLSQVVEVHP